ncbi:OmpA family protein [Vibrio quintilis]|uniref:Outer membrane porin F n=1 Tax=Vibrio quintilis TaxID=1117707 RepID=A0A1M7YZQ3_9VIBR|nr:OmpA family protein [Vibrio quintilis]SHO58167.1 Outer membrane porin F precursor [Vibrio quintilis]
MKYITCLLLTLFLSGCGTLVSTERLFDDNLLNTAPKTDRDVRYPDWGRASDASEATSVGNSSSRTTMQRRMQTQSYLQLEEFLTANGIDYEVLPGKYLIIRVKRTIKFETGSSRVSVSSKMWLGKIRRYLETDASRDLEVVIDGHTDDMGSTRLNEQLSKKRAESVKALLVSGRVYLDSVYTRGYGAVVPACTNKTRQGKACNRRVELFFILPS